MALILLICMVTCKIESVQTMSFKVSKHSYDMLTHTLTWERKLTMKTIYFIVWNFIWYVTTVKSTRYVDMDNLNSKKNL